MQTINWDTVQASSLFKIQGGNAFKSSDAREDGIRWLKIANVSFQKINWNEKSFLPNEFLNQYKDYILNEGDIVMSLTRPVLSGKLKISKISKKDSPSLLNQRVGRLILKDNVKPDFLYQLLLQRRIAYEVEQNLQGSDPPNLSMNTFDSIYLPLPPLPEQKAIAETLSLWDEAIAKLERLIELKEKRFRWLLNELIGKKIKEAETKDNGWKKVKLGEVGEIRKGTQLNRSDMIEEGNFYVLNGGIEPSGKTNEFNCLENTITISEGGNSCGYVNLNSEKFWLGGHCYALENLKESIDRLFLYFFLKFKQEDIQSLRVGSGLPNIQKKDLENFPIFIPNFEEQHKISSIFHLLSIETSRLNNLLTAIKVQKQGLMQKLLTGKWRCNL